VGCYWKASGMPVTSMINTWLKQPGFPVVEINQDGSNLKLKQKRYLLEPNKKFSKGLWSIPLSLGLETKLLTNYFLKNPCL